jgi:hypothetical protein
MRMLRAPSKLDRVARWIRADGLLRTDEHIMAEMIQALGFQKRGSRIVPALQAAIERTAPPPRLQPPWGT